MKKNLSYCLIVILSFSFYQCNNSDIDKKKSCTMRHFFSTLKAYSIMKKPCYILSTIILLISLCQCTGNKKDAVIENSNQVLSMANSTDTEQTNREKAWEEANKYKASITDTTFLQTKDKMSDSAIDPFNPNYAFNQVVYLKALERMKKHLTIKDNQLICNIDSGKDLSISEDLYQYIMDILENWNKGIKEKQYKIIKTDYGYDIKPIIKK